MQKIDGTGMLQSGGHLTEVSMQFGLVKHRTLQAGSTTQFLAANAFMRLVSATYCSRCCCP